MSSSDPFAKPSQSKNHGLPPVVPDVIEQDLAGHIDNIVPSRSYQTIPMVGLGGSAGSIQALLQLFRTMPADTGMSFVVVLHLSPTHESSLASMIGGTTTMPVMEASDGQKVYPNCVYVIPPAKYLVTVDGHLRLTDLPNMPGKRLAVDVFFRSLADTHGPHAVAVVLSGADGDGAIGIKRIKERGGLTIAQDPDEAEHPSMPQTAMSTGMVDWVLNVDQIPRRLLDYYGLASRLKLPPEEGPQPTRHDEDDIDDRERALREVLVFLQLRTGRDFSHYKRATIVRRIARRMQVNGVENLRAYLDFLRMHPGEAAAALQDLLISVTNFFRDREVFESLDILIPGILKNKTQEDTVRVWCPACATGEEAYSLAILLREHATQLSNPPAIQVFACDLNEQAIHVARAGFYPDTIAADVSEDRLRRFFVKEARGYRVRRELRETILFASHDLLVDAPFSRMDLVSCRNLLIYLNRSAQKRVFDVFHFALKPGGLLLLGSSEVVEDESALFRPLNKKHRIYASLANQRASIPLPEPGSLVRAMNSQEPSKTGTLVHGKQFMRGTVSFQSRLGFNMDRTSLANLHFQLIERYAPPSMIVNAEHDIVHLSEHSGEFLRFGGGEPTTNILRLVHPALRLELRSLLFRVAETKSQQSSELSTELDGELCSVITTVTLAPEVGTGYFLITIQKRAGTSEGIQHPAHVTAQSSQEVPQLEQEVEHLKATLRDTVEQYEASTEELKAGNEELQAMNEELRSATEELETSREELQSINEELTTVNQEMKSKMDELAHANSDLQNLMAATAIATVFLDRGLAITRYTPTAAGIFNMIPGDIGRPLAHLRHRLDYPEIIEDAEQVLQTLVPIEREVSDGDRWYFARMQPYRTVEDKIAGAVLTLVDVTERNRASEALRQSEEHMRILIESAQEYAIITTDRDRRIDSWNKGAAKLFGYAESQIIGELADILFTPEDQANGDPKREAETARVEGQARSERWHARRDGSTFYGSGSVMPLLDKASGLRGYVKIMRELTESKHSQGALQDHMEELTSFNVDAAGRELRMVELKEEVNELCTKLGIKVRYSLDADQPEADGPS